MAPDAIRDVMNSMLACAEAEDKVCLSINAVSIPTESYVSVDLQQTQA